MNQVELNEFALIDKLTHNLPKYRQEIIKGIGDDCAVLKQGDKNMLVTCDCLVSGTHFLIDATTPENIGYKAIAVNVSDIAAMGGKPTYCLVSLVLPKSKNTAYAESIYKGIRTACAMYDVQIIGGNISAGKTLMVDVFMMGSSRPDETLMRSGARPGDKILVTETLGGAAAGLALIMNSDIILPEPDRLMLLDRQLSPAARLAESEVIAKSKLATSMIDISDGLLSDIGHICDQSDVGALIYEKQVPTLAATESVESQSGPKACRYALSGGEDYELLFTASPEAAEKIIKMVARKTKTAVSIIGEILPSQEGRWLFGTNGYMQPIKPDGWNHLRDT